MSRLEELTIKIASCNSLKREEDYWPEILAEEFASCEPVMLKDIQFIQERLSQHMSPIIDDDKIESISSEIHRKIAPREVNVLGNIKRVFGKELKKRPYFADSIDITPEQITCAHDWYHDQGGAKCLVCNFETTKTEWHCSNGCKITLCGSCAFKWKTKM